MFQQASVIDSCQQDYLSPLLQVGSSDLVASSFICPMKLSLRSPPLEPHLDLWNASTCLRGFQEWPLLGRPVGRKTACVLLYRGLAEPSPPNLKTPSCGPGSSSRVDLLSYACLHRFCPFGILEGVPPQALSSFLVSVSFLCSFDEGFFFFK